MRALRRVGASVLLGCGLASSSVAGINEFTALGPEGGMINKLAYHPEDSSIVYAATGSGFYRSTDSGGIWQFVTDAFLSTPGDIAVHDVEPTRVFVVTHPGGLFSSEDSGASLTQLSTFPSPHESVGQIEFAVDGTLYVATIDRVFRSTNYGNSWVEGGVVPPTDTAIRKLRVDPENPAVLYILTADTSAFRSINGGESWEPIDMPDGVLGVNDLAISGAAPTRIWAATTNGVWLSVDDGDNWSNPQTHGPFATVHNHPTQASSVYAGRYADGLYRIDNDGADWTLIQGDARTGVIQTLAIDPRDPVRLLLGGWEGIAASDNAGVDWVARNSGILGARTNLIVPALGSDRIYIGTSFGGVFFTTGDDLTVTPVDNEELRQLSSSPVNPYPLWFSARGLHVESGDSDNLYVAIRDGIARSPDGGESWQLLTTGSFDESAVESFATASFAGQEFLLATTRTSAESALWRSTNDGNNWDPVPDLQVDSVGPALAVAPSNPAVVFLGTYTEPSTSAVLKSEDGGLTWNPTGAPSDTTIIIRVDPHNDQIVYLGTTQELLKSTDGGESWSELSWRTGSGGTWAVAIDPQNTNIVFAADPGGIGRSVDGGQTWEALPVEEAPAYWDVRSLAVDPTRPHRLFAAAQDHGVREISIQPDLSLAVSEPIGPHAYGVPISFAYMVSNAGPFDATGIVTTIQLDASAANIGVTASAGSCTQAATSIVCTQPILRVGESTQIDVTVTHPDAGGFDVIAAIEGEQPNAADGDNSVELTIDVVRLNDLAVAATGPAALVEGSAATYTVAVTNEGPSDATGISLEFQLASGLSVDTVTSSTGTCATSASALVTCTIADLDASNSATITIVTDATSPGTYASTATVTTGGVDAVPNNNTATVTTTVSAQPPPPPPPQSPSPGNGGSGGGGGSSSLLLLVILGLLRLTQRIRIIRC